MVCLRGKTAKYRKVEEVWPPLKFNFTYWVVFSGWFGQENYEKSCHFDLGLSSLALDIWRLDIWRLQTSYLKIPATKKVETPQVILLSCNGIPGILTIAWPIFSQLMTTEHSRVPGLRSAAGQRLVLRMELELALAEDEAGLHLVAGSLQAGVPVGPGQWVRVREQQPPANTQSSARLSYLWGREEKSGPQGFGTQRQ